MANLCVDIVIRFKNEEFWLDILRKKFQSLTGVDIFLYGVDNNSTDRSREVFNQFSNPNLKYTEIINIDVFRPGASLNLGACIGKSPYILFLSAHCVPKNDNYLELLTNAIHTETPQCAGVFGRQLPLPCSGPQNTVDLALTYPKEDRIFRRTPVFNNANSIVRRSVFNNFNFHSEVTNLEDLIWAKEVHQHGLYTKYVSFPEVYHYHGIHQHPLHSGNKRVSQSIDVLISYNWLKIDKPVFCMVSSYIFRVVSNTCSLVMKWNDKLDLLLERPLHYSESLEEFDYTVFIKGELDHLFLAKSISSAIEQNSQFSFLQQSQFDHNLQQYHSDDSLNNLIESSSHGVFVVSRPIARRLEAII